MNGGIKGARGWDNYKGEEERKDRNDFFGMREGEMELMDTKVRLISSNTKDQT
jgi:hypothetical protein